MVSPQPKLPNRTTKHGMALRQGSYIILFQLIITSCSDPHALVATGFPWHGNKISIGQNNSQRSFQLAIVLFLDKKNSKFIWGGSELPKGGDIPRVFAPLLRGGRISWGGEIPVTPVKSYRVSIYKTQGRSNQ